MFVEITYRAPVMSVDFTIVHSDVRLGAVTLARPGEAEPFFRIAGRSEQLSASRTEAMHEASRSFAIDPWPTRIPQ
jgi:hypothetical protein